MSQREKSGREGAPEEIDIQNEPSDGTPAEYVQPLLSPDLVPSDAGGMTDRCEHVFNGVRCSNEAYAVCEHCQ
eukprot:7760034-Karenia_brevis.AAC.1